MKNCGQHANFQKKIGIPPANLIERYIICNTPECGTHMFWHDSGKIRSYDRFGQAVYVWKKTTYNVVRLLLEYRFGYKGIVAENTCGLPQCINLAHWRVLQYRGSRAHFLHFATALVNDVWRLTSHGKVLRRDTTFVASVGPVGPNNPAHIIRALYDDRETTFRTACNQAVNPAYVVTVQTDATCKACLV